MELSITLQPKQKEAIKTLKEHQVVFFGGAKGGGKSYLARAWNVLRRIKYPRTHGVIIRRTYPELYANHIKKFFTEYPELMNKYYNATHKTIEFPNGSTLKFDYLHRPDDVYRYQGVEYDDITIDEITQHDEEVFKIIRTSLRTTSHLIQPRMLLTGNPGGKGHGWVKRIFVDKDFKKGEKPADFGFVQAFVHDNSALLMAMPEYLQILEDLPPAKRMAYLEGRWDVFEGQFFEMWNPLVHVTNEVNLKTAKAIYICGDYGYRAPSAVLWVMEDYDGNLIAYKELYGTGMDYYQLSQRMRAMTSNEEMALLRYAVFDTSIWETSPSGGRSGGMILGDLFPMRKASKDRVIGWTKLKQMLTPINKHVPPQLRFTSACVNTTRSLPLMVYVDSDMPNSNKEDMESSNVDDHCADAIRYLAMSFVKTTSTNNPQELVYQW